MHYPRLGSMIEARHPKIGQLEFALPTSPAYHHRSVPIVSTTG